MQFIYYPKCSTCLKALDYLKAHGLNPTLRDIVIDNPTKEELKSFIELAHIDIQKAFNTSGLVYKALDLKNKMKDLSDDEKLSLLASDGKLIKRPIIVTDKVVFFGFKEEQYKKLLEK